MVWNAELEKIKREQRQKDQRSKEPMSKDKEQTTKSDIKDNNRRKPKDLDNSSSDPLQVAAEMDFGGTSMSREAPDEVKKAREEIETVKKASKRLTSSTMQIRDFPRSLVKLARSEFYEANNNTDALACYMAWKSGNLSDLTDTQLNLLKIKDTNDSYVEFNQRLDKMEKLLSTTIKKLNEVELAVCYMLYDRLGFRVDTPMTPKDVNMLEAGMFDMVERLEQQLVMMRKRMNMRRGSDIK